MAVNNLSIPRQYQSTNYIDKDGLDLIFDTIEKWALNNNRNLNQIVLDLFKRGYALSNDGAADFNKTIQDQLEFPNVLVWQDDFMEAAASLSSTVYSNAHWTGSGTNGTQAIVAGVGGWCRLDTTSTSSSTSILTFTTANFDTTSNPIVEFYFKADNVTNCTYNLGFYASSDDYAYIEFNTSTSAASIYLKSKNNGATEVSTDTLVDIRAGVFFKVKIQLLVTGGIKAYIDDVQVAELHTGSVQSLATFKPRVYADNKSASQSNKLDLDYVRILQDRSA